MKVRILSLTGIFNSYEYLNLKFQIYYCNVARIIFYMLLFSIWYTFFISWKYLACPFAVLTSLCWLLVFTTYYIYVKILKKPKKAFLYLKQQPVTPKPQLTFGFETVLKKIRLIKRQFSISYLKFSKYVSETKSFWFVFFFFFFVGFFGVLWILFYF